MAQILILSRNQNFQNKKYHLKKSINKKEEKAKAKKKQKLEKKVHDIKNIKIPGSSLIESFKRDRKDLIVKENTIALTIDENVVEDVTPEIQRLIMRLKKNARNQNESD